MNNRANPNVSHKVSHKDIVVTIHAQQRAKERLNLTHVADIRKIAVAAKTKGINVKSLTYNNCQEHKISPELLKVIKQSFFINSNSNKIYYYKGNVFVFIGKKSCTLKTIVNIKEQFKNGLFNDLEEEEE